MRFLRRNAAPAEVDAEPTSDAAVTPATGKGRPTPKRREAEARRRGPVAPPPRTQREALKRMRGTRGTKEERQAERLERRERMLSGDDRYLLPRDRGVVRAYARDMVDSRRNLMGLFMPVAGLVLLTLFLDPRIQSYVSLLTAAMLVVMIIETLMLTRVILRGARVRFPGEEIRPVGLGFYVMTRGTMLRRLRTPRPRVGYGAKIA